MTFFKRIFLQNKAPKVKRLNLWAKELHFIHTSARHTYQRRTKRRKCRATHVPAH
jgi:hypothetical protein